MAYWVYIDTETGRQVEYADEFNEWWVVGKEGAEALLFDHPVEIVRVELTDDRYPVETISDSNGDPLVPNLRPPAT